MTADSNAQLTSVVVPAFNEGPMIASVVAELKAAAPWREILVVDDGSTDRTGEEAVRAGARVVRHPYNKGNGAAVNTGIREAAGTFVLIIDADGQHQPADAVRLVAHLDTDDLVVGARAPTLQAGRTRRAGNARPVAAFPISLPDSVPRGAPACWSSCTCCRTASRRRRPPRSRS